MSHEERFNLSAWTLRHQSLVFFLMGLIALFGVLSYKNLSQSEDPPFTFKVMVIQTYWPGATAKQVQEEITDRIGRKLQETADIDFLRSYSRPGESLIFFNIKDSAPASEVPETWYQVRKKVGDIAAQLPQGVQGPFFNDEFGDVYTNIYALEGDGYTPAQLHDYADQLRVELLRVPGIGKVDYFGDQNQHIYIDVTNATLAKLGISPQQIGQAINDQNAVASTGVLTTADDRVFVRPSGQLDDMGALANTLLHINGKSFRLGDIATIQRGYDDPPSQTMRFMGQQVLGIGVTMQPGGDVIHLGKALDGKIGELQKRLPAGLKLSEVTSMPHAVSHSVDDFLESVAEAVGIVLLVSLLSLGFRTGMVVVISIPFVLAATALCMDMFGIGLHKVSLGTLVLALGLLVDDAIIAVEMMSVKLEQGWGRVKAAAFAYTSTAFPMLTGTLVTVSGFLPIALAKSSTGEYTRSIFEVSAIALLVSWLAAVIVIPLLGYHMLPEHHERAKPGQEWWARFLPQRWNETRAAKAVQPVHNGEEIEIYDTTFYRRFRGWLDLCLRQRWLVLLSTVVLFVIALGGFALVPKQFFPSSDRPELLVDLRLPEGASYAATLRETQRFEAVLKGRKDIANYVSFVGSGAPRFYLPLDQQLAQPNFAQFVITAKDVKQREELANYLEGELKRDFSAVRTRVSRLENGPPVGFPVQFRVEGDDIATVRGIAEQVAGVMRANPDTTNVQFDWDEPAERSVRFEVDQFKARQLGLTSKDIADFLAMNLSGTTVTQFRERDKLIAVDLRSERGDRIHPDQIERLAIPTASGTAIPLAQLGHVAYGLEYGVIWERDRQPTITVQSDTRNSAQGLDVTNTVDKQLADIRAHLPVGYRVEVGGSVEQNQKAQDSVNVQMPVLLVAVLVLLMIQLQSFGRTFMVVLTAPLGLIGVIVALLVAHQPYGFVAMLGTIAMFGIIMRNSVILVDQIEQDIRAGHPRWEAIVGATVRRFRPITLTAAAAVLALIPLLRSNFFGPMATALMGGITVATVLTLFYLPALYAAWFRVRADEPAREPEAVT
ncbi:efflux RND transporter permease subunit [Dyella nitratireducens]|uniref:Drug-resistance cell envelope-like protein n=1 Tax=Dyella nitratireducens TaxID=1849580 RepID=A0ABQ1FS88_9GAMM|nr:efflux RND transporter permease subunit [Dyella nitratireducens]GGA25626.1 drug-resistance cell envelope-like protein [Dyella nitratireducens]GLQ43660.1 drug-resistance cell envelope-like protein [Dyella nitratireducens]